MKIKSLLFNNLGWHSSFCATHQHALQDNDTTKLRFILGCGRSGTSWMARTVAESDTPLRYCHEILTYVQPIYSYSRKFDHTATPYLQEIDETSSLASSFSVTTSPLVNWEKLLPGRERQVQRNDTDFEVVLHKEVHSLLAAEGMVRLFKDNKFVFVVRNPILNIDSLFNYHPLSAIIWRNEYDYIKKRAFCNRFLDPEQAAMLKRMQRIYKDDGAERRSTISAKVITVAIINTMLIKLAREYKNVMLVRYEDLCLDPQKMFLHVCDFLGLEFNENRLENVLHSQKKKKSIDPMSIDKNSKMQIERKMYFLSTEEVDHLSLLLEQLGYEGMYNVRN